MYASIHLHVSSNVQESTALTPIIICTDLLFIVVFIICCFLICLARGGAGAPRGRGGANQAVAL